MAVPDNITAAGINSAEDPGAFVTNLVASRVIPGVALRVRGSLYLFMGGNIDRLIGIIIVGTMSRVTTEAGSVGHRCIECTAEITMIGAECIRCALTMRTVDADILTSLREYKEEIATARSPTVAT